MCGRTVEVADSLAYHISMNCTCTQGFKERLMDPSTHTNLYGVLPSCRACWRPSPNYVYLVSVSVGNCQKHSLWKYS